MLRKLLIIALFGIIGNINPVLGNNILPAEKATKWHLSCSITAPPLSINCKLTRDKTASAARIDASTTFDGETLSLKNPVISGMKREPVVIENDFELDETTSKVLGYKKITVLAGTYDVSNGKQVNFKAKGEGKLNCDRF
jgi:hypothetical protein